jgi:hypothetical protein
MEPLDLHQRLRSLAATRKAILASKAAWAWLTPGLNPDAALHLAVIKRDEVATRLAIAATSDDVVGVRA